jgi:hypothetical protein
VTRFQALLVALALALCLIAGSTAGIVGDGGEYVVMAMNLARFDRPAIGARDIRRLQPAIAKFDPDLSNWDIRAAGVQGSDGRRDFVHFWFYSLLAVPPLWVTQAINVTPVAAFTFLNLVMWGLAFWFVFPKVGPAASILLFGGPIVWWLDKPHTEPFTFSLIALALVLMRDKASWALIAAGVAATQNPPITALIGLIAVAHVLTDRKALRDRRFLVSAAVAFGLAALQPVYTYLRHSIPSLLLIANPARRPTLAEIAAVPLDPSVGLVSNFPIFVVVVIAAVALIVMRRWRELLASDVIVAALAGIAFLLSFAQATNVHHGATPGMSRYAIWLVPLAIPILARANRLGGLAWRSFLWCAAIISAFICIRVFHPSVPQNSREPTLVAGYLWTKHPGWNNPLPEIFAETMLGREERLVPVATAGCEKVLLVGHGQDGAWPIPCFPAQLPSWCSRPGALCYANRVADRYDFVRPAGPPIQHAGFEFQSDWAWPGGAERELRRSLTELDWWHLKPPTDSGAVVRYKNDVRVWELDGPGRFVFVLRREHENPAIMLRLPAPMKGMMVDGMTGRTIADVHFDGPAFERWDLTMAPGQDLVLLSLWGA